MIIACFAGIVVAFKELPHKQGAYAAGYMFGVLFWAVFLVIAAFFLGRWAVRVLWKSNGPETE